MIISKHKNLNKAILTPALIAFALACCLLLLPGCVSDSAWEEPEEATVTTTTEAEYSDEDSYSYDESEDWMVPPNAEDLLTPTPEEIDRAMMQDAQEAMQDEYREYYMGYGVIWGY